MLKRIYNPIMATGFSALFTFQLELIQKLLNAQTYLQPYYDNEAFGNVYFSAGQH